MFFRYISLALFLILQVHCIEFPAFINKCSRIDVNHECGPTSANEALPILLQGSDELGIPNFFPYKIGTININSPHLVLTLNDVELDGFETVRVTNVTWVAPEMTVSFTMNRLNLTGTFSYGNQIFGTTLQPAGIASFSIENGRYSISSQFEKSTFDDFTRLFLVENLSVVPGRTIYKFNDLYTGATYMELTNSNLLSKEIVPEMEKALTSAYKSILTPFAQIPENDIFKSPLPALPPLINYYLTEQSAVVPVKVPFLELEPPDLD